LTKNVGIHIHYRLRVDDNMISDSLSQQNSLTILMQNARQT
ncbi:18081_t:CDS:1, partial [Funneliformis geosporum]